ncbi:DJ-1/PfpI family protein [Hyphomicrobium sp. DMF-1]|jgi:putative intracellular protease/amidase|uniref:DJ-1/PfpI family protein n=1 Tax=Hyphomicrobium sp. DMF-1 TaxID=3019544 RepID=UPI0022EBAAD0|nr:DJ-1/PfpI family protein [Hyphomicrobium sp. DMF-1]WBT36911.1 DJ-1/PfpI family protein [Hyphomicrobium sp. DMF-1]
MPLSKRDVLMMLAGGVGSTLFPATAGAAEQAGGAQSAHGDMHEMPASWYGKEQIAFLIYPKFTALDMVGPHYMLASLMGSTVHIVAKTKEPVVSDQQLVFMPSVTFDECPADLDIICVPGGSDGTLAAIEDEATIAFLKDRGSRAKYVTSVCTGSLVLGAAGLLKGYKATSHWATREILREFGAEPIDARVVEDRNRITGGGVTAGIDFGLTLVGKLRDRQYAEGVQLMGEYDPAPPFDSGSPAKASRVNLDMMTAMFAPFLVKAAEAARRAAAKNG